MPKEGARVEDMPLTPIAAATLFLCYRGLLVFRFSASRSGSSSVSRFIADKCYGWACAMLGKMKLPEWLLLEQGGMFASV